jgi:2-oxoisovalerate dehydrogenase E2 component (dihydrolipoyl transacylase)
MSEFKLPDVGEGLTEAEIVSWKVEEGDTVEINQVIVEIETAKSLVELPSPYAGTVQRLMVPEGETVPVGTPIIAIGDASAPADEPEEKTPGEEAAEMEIDLSNPAASGGGEGESLVGRNKVDRGPVRRARRAAHDTAGGASAQRSIQGAFDHEVSPDGPDVGPEDEPAVPATSARTAEGGSGRVLAKPPVRKLAKDLGVDLGRLAGSGEGGVVTREDVRAAADGGMTAEHEDLGRPGVQPVAGVRETREPIKGVRKRMAEAMSTSAFTSPHVTEWVTVDVTEGMAFVDRLRSRREFRDVRVSPLLLLARAAMMAMKRTPEINSYWDDEAQEVVYKGYVNLGIAAATPRGLVVPNVKDADQLSLRDLATALNDLTATAREGRTQPAEMSGGTFTITNVGVFGVDAGTPIINPGESAILCFGAVRKQPWVVEGPDGDRIEPRQVTTLALSFDHRHVDGEKGSRFLADVAGIMADPGTALLF